MEVYQFTSRVEEIEDAPPLFPFGRSTKSKNELEAQLNGTIERWILTFLTTFQIA